MVGIVYLNNQCNQKCIFCCGKYFRNFERNKHIILNKKNNQIIVSGGEPVLSDSFYSVLFLCRQNKKIQAVELQSNGVVFKDAKLVEKIAKLKIVTEFNINFPASSSRDDFLQTQASFFSERICGVRNLLNHKCNVKLNYTINSLNYKKILKFILFVRKTFKPLPSIQFSFLRNTGEAKKNKVMPRYSEVRSYLLKGLKIARLMNMSVMVDDVPACVIFPYLENSIEYNKRLQGGISFEKKKYLKSCASCCLKSLCLGVSKQYCNVYKNERFNPPITPKAPSLFKCG